MPACPKIGRMKLTGTAIPSALEISPGEAGYPCLSGPSGTAPG